MILQTGQRTDIPAFYGQWLINRVRQGFVDVRNPYNPIQITRYPINHEVVDGIAFCTKNPLPFIPLLHEINDYRQYWHMTITPYGADIDTNVPQVDLVIEGFKRISTKCNPQSMVWRYDPIILTHNYTVDFHFESFYKMAKSLEGYTDTVVVSFIDILVDAGANINYATSTANCAIENCMIHGRMDIMLYLLQKGADYRRKFTEIDLDKPDYPTFEVDILYKLRKCVYPIGSKEYTDKMKVVNFLKKKGLDYWKSPIPSGMYGVIMRDIAPKNKADFDYYIKHY